MVHQILELHQQNEHHKKQNVVYVTTEFFLNYYYHPLSQLFTIIIILLFQTTITLLISTFEMQPNSVRINLRLSFFFSPPVPLQIHSNTSQ
jgi:hypothetical protein